jgi:hypothetical protein
MAIETVPSEEKFKASENKDNGSIKVGISSGEVDLESREVFQTGDDVLEFRTVSWQRATIVFCKVNFAMSILAIPQAISTVGAVGGSLILVGFTSLNVCKYNSYVSIVPLFNCIDEPLDTALILGEFRNRHPECHSK